MQEQSDNKEQKTITREVMEALAELLTQPWFLVLAANVVSFVAAYDYAAIGEIEDWEKWWGISTALFDLVILHHAKTSTFGNKDPVVAKEYQRKAVVTLILSIGLAILIRGVVKPM
ncbi:MAG: hypothetical protein WAU07_01180 [Microgenomates group bacterium]